MDKKAYEALEACFAPIFAQLSSALEGESAAHVERYVACGELEMAYEWAVRKLRTAAASFHD